MSATPDDLKYSKSHEWVRSNADGTVTIGITDHAQDQLGDLVYVEVPEAGRELALGDACAVVESVKAASDVYAPVGGTVVAGNAALADAPEVVNTDPYGEGWLLKLNPTDAAGVNSLMNASEYQAFVESE
jgi:glycine cleavage system H protein